MESTDNPENELVRLLPFVSPRYCSTPFPAYRFISGRNPHPTADPEGHSYHAPGSPTESISLVIPAEWAKSSDYLYGCDLYNHAYWWEAHEAWEGQWQLTDKTGIQGRFLQGLIQVSACHLKRFVRHAKGVERLRRRSLEYLRAVVDETTDVIFMGLDLAAFVARFEAYYDTRDARANITLDHDSRAYPYLRLEGPDLSASTSRSR
ncbi:MAG: DUF309 domain-containing protein [Planctomycetes bacterium]|nr:DUF309 domain-containing protein [Planctomycetota bacterium]